MPRSASTARSRSSRPAGSASDRAIAGSSCRACLATRSPIMTVPGLSTAMSSACRSITRRARSGAASERQAGESARAASMSMSDDTGALDYQRAREAASGGIAADELQFPPARFVAATAVVLVLAGAIHLVGTHGDPAPQLQLSLILGAVFGFVLQRSRFCFL